MSDVLFVTVCDEFERFLAAEPLVTGLEVDFEILFAAGFVVVVVVAPVHGHVHAPHFADRVLKLWKFVTNTWLIGVPERRS